MRADAKPELYPVGYHGGQRHRNGAQGIGIQILRNNTPVVAGDKNALGYVSTTPVSLGLSAQYGLTSGQVTAGLVKSVIDVTFTYQ